MKPRRPSALRPWMIVEDLAAWKLSQKLDKPDRDSKDRFSRSAAESWGVKWCRCRFKVFELECDGQHYCRCGYPIERYAFCDISPTKQALLPIVVVLAVIGLVYVLSAPMMNWDGKRPDCDGMVVACPEGKPPIICDDIQVACPKGG